MGESSSPMRRFAPVASRKVPAFSAENASAQQHGSSPERHTKKQITAVKDCGDLFFVMPFRT